MKVMEEVIKNDEPFFPLRTLKAGALSAAWEAGRLRYIQWNGREAVRMIFPAMRDENWVTIPFSLSNETITENNSGFEIRAHASFSKDNIRYEADFFVKGTDAGELIYEMSGTAHTGFKSKRTGLCVHHPVPSCAGRPVDIIKPGNEIKRSFFPVLIDPERPFTDITGMQWTNKNNIHIDIRFEGDLFETEDQRNWGDDSYKTYSGPQYKTPMLHIKAGDTMLHRITVKMENREVLSQKNTFPETGSYFTGITPNNVRELWHKAGLEHITAELKLNDPNYAQHWKNVVETARGLQTKIRAHVVFNDFSAKSVNNCVELITKEVTSILVLSDRSAVADPATFSEVYTTLKKIRPDVQIGYGSNSWFANVNATLTQKITCDFIGFLLMPQVHQFDHRSILENLLSQTTILDTIRQFYTDVPVHIYLRFSKGDDPRLQSSFAAWWTLNAIANLAAAGVLTLYDLHEVMQSPDSSLFQLLKKIHDFRPGLIGFERTVHAENPMDTVRSSKVFLEKGAERIYFTMNDI